MAAEKSSLAASPQLDDSVLALRKHFKGLEEKYRTALSLHYEQGLTYREVAAVLHKPEGTAASLITRGVELLRQSLSQEGHTIAPAVVALQLAQWSAGAAARPELLAAIKSALAAKSIAAAGTATAVTAKSGATLLTGKAALAAGLLVTAAIVLAVTQYRPPVTVPAAPPLPAPILPVGGAPGTAPGTAPVARPQFVNSVLPFNVFVWQDDVLRQLLGSTPHWTESGLRVPDNDLWVVQPSIRQQDPAPASHLREIIADVRAIDPPGLDLTNYDGPAADDVAADLTALPNLKTLIVAFRFFTPKQLPQLGRMKSLERLYLGDASKIDISDKTVALIASLPNLKSLHLPTLSDAAAAQLLNMPKLERFSGIISPLAFAKLASHPTLARLDLRGSDVLDETILSNPTALPKHLTSLSLGRSTEKLLKLDELRKQLPHVKINGWNALADEPPGQKSQDEEVLETLQLLDRSRHDAKVASLLPKPNPEIIAVLKNRKITFEFVDLPLNQALAQIADHSGVRIVMDPLIPASDGMSSVNLRVTDMDCDLAMRWILRLANLEYVALGRTLVVMSPTVANTFYRPEPRDYTLSVDAADKPWTLDETSAFAALVNTWAIDAGHVAKFPGEFYGLQTRPEDPPPCTVLSAGKIHMADVGSDAEADGCKALIDDFTQSAPRAVLPRTMQATLQQLDTPLTLTPPAKRITVVDAVALLNKSTHLSLIVDPGLVKQGLTGVLAPEGWPGKAATAKDALIALCSATKMNLTFDQDWVAVGKSPDPMQIAHPTLLDLRPALKAGVNAQQLTAALAEIASSGFGIAPVVIRGRWVAATDPVIARRAMTVVDEAAKSGKITIPPLPWYCELARHASEPSPPPPPPKDDYDGKGF